ncbi:MAG: hypothetical protein LBC72_01685, partial [Spirochaetaceae bacterium]|nr:hypothetical protein [Spirochaetaceae bacterium]
MGYSVFSAGRDLLYLAAALLGTAAGLFSAAFFPSRTHSQRSRDITAAFYVVSAAVAAAGGALCVRQDLLFTAGVLPCAGVIALVFFAAFLFSAVLRFTLFIII